MHVHCFASLALAVAMAVPAMAQVTPPPVLSASDPALRLWLKSDTGITLGTQGTGAPGPPVTQWVDQSQYGTIMAPRTESHPDGPFGGFPVEERPHLVTSTVNGNSFPTVRFDRDGSIFITGDPNVDNSGSTDRLHQTNNLTPGSDPLDIGDGTSVTSFTVFNPSVTANLDLGPLQTIWAKRTQEASVLTLGMSMTSTAGRFAYVTYDTNLIYKATNKIPATPKWHILAQTITEAGANDQLSFLINDTEDPTAPLVNNPVFTNGGLIENRGDTTNVPPGTLVPFGIGTHSQICCGDGESWAGNIAELIIFARTLTAQEFADVEDYLNAKYLTAAPMGVLGDYNENEVVDAADYVVWRDNLGQFFALPGENPAAATEGFVDGEDYNFWKANFGNMASGSASAAAVPEPATIVGLMVGVSLCALPRFHRGRSRRVLRMPCNS